MHRDLLKLYYNITFQIGKGSSEFQQRRCTVPPITSLPIPTETSRDTLMGSFLSHTAISGKLHSDTRVTEPIFCITG